MIMETKVEFKTEELFRNLIDVSAFNFKKYSYLEGYSYYVRECASIISLGRQKGATSTIAKIAAQGFDDAVTVIVVPNSNVKRMYYETGLFEESRNYIKSDFKTVITHIESSHQAFRGIKATPRFNKMNIIFDCCRLEQVNEYMQELNRNNLIGQLKINSVLINQPM